MLLSYINSLSNKFANDVLGISRTAKLRKFSVDKNRGQIIFILSTVSAVKRTGDRGQRHTPFRGVCPLLSAATHVRYQRSSQRIYLKRGGLSNLGCLWDAISIGSGANKRTTNVSGHGLGRLRASWGICSPSGETPIGCGIYRGQKPRTNKNAFVHGFYFLGVTTHHSRWPKTTPVRNASSPRAVQLGMVSTSAIRRLAEIVPESETHWRDVAAAAHRAIGGPGSEAAARTHETLSWEIREGLTTGTTRGKLCRPCLSRGYRYLLIWVGGRMRCGTCHQATLSP